MSDLPKFKKNGDPMTPTLGRNVLYQDASRKEPWAALVVGVHVADDGAVTLDVVCFSPGRQDFVNGVPFSGEKPKSGCAYWPEGS